LKKTIHRLTDDDADIRRWCRLTELAGEPDAIDDLLAEIEQRALEDSQVDARNQLELFGQMLAGPGRRPARRDQPPDPEGRPPIRRNVTRS
jgi:hypothetical protein